MALRLLITRRENGLLSQFETKTFCDEYATVRLMSAALSLPRNLCPMPLSHRSEPFDSDQFIYELKVDGFRALAHIQAGKGELISRKVVPPQNPISMFQQVFRSQRS